MAEIKCTIRVPTTTYGFIELVAEVESPKDAVELHNNAVALYNAPVAPETALQPKEFNQALDSYLETNKLLGGVELWEKMSPTQQEVFQTIKRSLKRIEAKQK